MTHQGRAAQLRAPSPPATDRVLQRAAVQVVAGGTGIPQIVHEALRSPGRPLDGVTRDFMEPRFGHDFSAVRVHDDARAAESARAVDAVAYTVGHHVAFDTGRYAPATPTGRALLAHELTHVLQQGSQYVQRSAATTKSLTDAEAQADILATAISRGESLAPGTPQRLDAGTVQRQEAAPATHEADNGEQEVQDGDSPTGSGLVPVDDRAESAGDIGEEAIVAYAPEFVALQAKPAAGAKQRPTAPERNREQTRIPRTIEGWWITEITVDLTTQKLTYVRSDGRKSKPITISSGKGRPNTTGDPCAHPGANGSLCTPTGTFSPDVKGDGGYTNSRGDHMSWYVQFHAPRGIGIHDSQKVTGRPASHGCVRIDPINAELINKHVVRSTTITVSGKAPTKPWKSTRKGG